jgi:hypothetical protein
MSEFSKFLMPSLIAKLPMDYKREYSILLFEPLVNVATN